MNIFKKFIATLKFNEAVRKANNEHAKTGNRYYVMRTSGTSGQLIIMDRKNFRLLKQKRYISNKVFVRDLEKECFYCTPYKNGSGELPPKIYEFKKQCYFNWLENIKKKK